MRAPLPSGRSVPAGPHRVRLLLAAAAALVVASLALPWRNSHLQMGLTTAWIPGDCHLNYNGYSYCESGHIAWGSYTQLAGPVAGLAQPIRVLAVLAAIAVGVAVRRRSRAAARLGLAVGGFGLLMGGLAPTAGRLTFLVALAMAAVALDRAGLLRSHRSTALRPDGLEADPPRRVQPVAQAAAST